MNSVAKIVVATLFCALFLALSPNNASAQAQKRHPAYLHALADLRDARANLEHSDHGELLNEEKEAMHHIDSAINEIRKASIDDGKDVNDHTPVDVRLDRHSRLRHTLELLRKARQDIEQDEDNEFAQGLRHRAFNDIDTATSEVQAAIHIVESHS